MPRRAARTYVNEFANLRIYESTKFTDWNRSICKSNSSIRTFVNPSMPRRRYETRTLRCAFDLRGVEAAGAATAGAAVVSFDGLLRRQNVTMAAATNTLE